MISADSVRLQQIFWNVLRNAVKFTPEQGKITIRTFLRQAGRRIWRNDHRYRYRHDTR